MAAEAPRVPVLVLGASGVGKTAYLWHVKLGEQFDPAEPRAATIGVDLETVLYDVPGADTSVVLIFNDCAGARAHHALLPIVARHALIVFFVYDVTDRATFADVEARWLPHVEQHCRRRPLRVLLGNKGDLVRADPARRAVTREEAAALARRMDARHCYELSSTDTADDALVQLRQPLDIALTELLDECRDGRRSAADGVGCAPGRIGGGGGGSNPLADAGRTNKESCC